MCWGSRISARDSAESINGFGRQEKKETKHGDAQISERADDCSSDSKAIPSDMVVGLIPEPFELHVDVSLNKSLQKSRQTLVIKHI